MREYFMVKRDYKGSFKIGIGVGRTFKANDLSEVARGLMHYFNDVINVTEKSPFDRKKHLEHIKECSCCPLCSNVEGEQKPRKGKRHKR